MGSQRVGHNWATFTHSLTDFLNCEKEILRYTWKRKYFLYKLVTQWMNNSTNQHFGRLSLIKRHGRCRFFLTMITSQDFKRIDKTFFLQVKISFSWTLLSRDVLYACIQCAPRFQGKVKGTVLYYQWKYLEYHALYPILSQEPISTIKTPNLLFFFFLLQTSFGGLHWVFVAVHELSLVATSGGYLLLQCCTAWVWGHVGFSSGGAWA